MIYFFLKNLTIFISIRCHCVFNKFIGFKDFNKCFSI